MWGLSLITAIMLIGLGIAIGMYIASQISESIEQSRRHKKFMHDMENFDKIKNKKKYVDNNNYIRRYSIYLCL